MNEPSRRLLVIDDDILVRQSIVAYLGDSGYQVHDEANGREGIAWFEQNRPDLVLTDLRMPDIDGLNILRHVKDLDPTTPVIVISGMGMVSDVAEALRLGAADYLVKPLVDMEVLTHSINKALEVLDLQRDNLRYRQELEHANSELREHVRVLERDQQAGRQVQGNLLPPTPLHYNDIQLAHKIVPSLFLSGDFVDYGLIGERYLCCYLTDVSGHGASSAFVTVWLKQLVQRLIGERRLREDADGFDIDLGQWLALINKELIRSKFGCHLTCFVGIIDLKTRKMRYVLAGHLPLPVLMTERGAGFLPGKGKPVGIFEHAQWEVFEANVPANASLVVFSDGVLEILPPKELIAKEQYLLDLLADTRGDIDRICMRLGLGQLEDAPDDIAIMTINTGDLK